MTAPGLDAEAFAALVHRQEHDGRVISVTQTKELAVGFYRDLLVENERLRTALRETIQHSGLSLDRKCPKCMEIHAALGGQP